MWGCGAGEAGRADRAGGFALALASLTLAGLQAQSAPLAESCASLGKVTMPNVTITSASLVAAGSMPPPPARGGGPGPAATNPFADLPAVCRVAATLKPSTD